MSTRQMDGPSWDVKRNERDDEIVSLTFRVPGSKFGPVLVNLTAEDADCLADAIREEVRQLVNG